MEYVIVYLFLLLSSSISRAGPFTRKKSRQNTNEKTLFASEKYSHEEFNNEEVMININSGEEDIIHEAFTKIISDPKDNEGPKVDGGDIPKTSFSTHLLDQIIQDGRFKGGYCFACRHKCCSAHNCTMFECPTCHLNIPQCGHNCPCNIFTSEDEVEKPWIQPKVTRQESTKAKDGLNEGSDDVDNKYKDDDSDSSCGPPVCLVSCGPEEWCANTGTCVMFPCCQNFHCIPQ